MTANNRYDSEFCGALPLHLINNIQSYGYLLVLDIASLHVLQVSQNITDITGIDYREMIGKSAYSFFDTKTISRLLRMFTGNIHVKVPVRITLNEKTYSAVIHHTGNYLMLELEDLDESETSFRSFVDVYGQLKYAMACMESVSGIEELHSIVLKELKQLSGFDRVMVYRFDEAWNGTFIAEIKPADMQGYLGLQFPASDIPQGARALYQSNPYRLIPDRTYKPVGLYPVINPTTEQFIDLSYCNLRGVAAVHLEYMKNMNIQASMSLRILYDCRLWGLISCHHERTHHPSVETCTAMEMLSQVYSNKIASLERLSYYEQQAAAKNSVINIIQGLNTSSDLKGIIGSDETYLTDLLELDGIALVADGQLHKLGSVPDTMQLHNLVMWHQARQQGRIFATSDASAVFEGANAFREVACGIIIIPLFNEKEEYGFILGFRREKIANISWGGNPDERIQFDPDSKNYHPRASFKKWQQQIAGQSMAWTPQVIDIAHSLQDAISSWIHKHVKKGRTS